MTPDSVLFLGFAVPCVSAVSAALLPTFPFVSPFVDDFFGNKSTAFFSLEQELLSKK